MINLRTRKLQKMPDEVREKCFWYAEEAPARQAIAPLYTKQKIPEVAMPAEVREASASLSKGSHGAM